MALILDTYNVVHAGNAMGGGMADLTVRRLCQWIVQWPHRTKTTLVLDGRAKPEEPGMNEFPELTLVYSGAGISADLVIGQMVERSTGRRNLVVVTNDRAVAAAARRMGAGVRSCESFLTMLMTAKGMGAKLGKGGKNSGAGLPAQKTAGVGDEAMTEHWMKEFGVGQTAEEKAALRKKKENTDDPDSLDMGKLMGF